MRSRVARTLAWMIALSLLAFLCVWPIAGGMVIANDDFKFVRGADYAGSFMQDVREGWNNQSNFRPLENLAALLCDAQSLECRGVMIIHIACLSALALGVARLTRRLLPNQPLAMPLLLIWIALSPATSISLWQMDTGSQTCTAALGVWTGVLAIAGVDAARAGRGVWPQVLVLLLICGVAVNIKEMFYGWSAGIGTALIIAILGLWKRERAAALRSIWLLIPVALLPAVHLLIRMKYSALAKAVEGGASPEKADVARYDVGLGMNVVKNLWLSILGVFADGPLHLVKDDAAPLLLRLLPLAALLASFVALAGAGMLALVHRHNAPSTRRALLLAAFGGLASLSVTLPMGSVSELYGLGANIASGLLLVAAAFALWNPVDAQERSLTRAIIVGCSSILLIAGVIGLASRAYHFRLTWRYAHDLNAQLLAFQHSLPPHGDTADPARIHFSQACFSAQLHSQYIVSPILAIGLEESMHWMNRVDPARPVVFLSERTLGAKREHDLDVTCADLPVRGHW